MVHPSAPLIGVCPKTVRCAQRGSTPFKRTQLIEVHILTKGGYEGQILEIRFRKIKIFGNRAF